MYKEQECVGNPAERRPNEYAIRDFLYTNPETIENGLTPIGKEIPIGGGRIDLLFKDSEDKLLFAEIKTGDFPNAELQVTKYAASYIAHKKLDTHSVRRMVITPFGARKTAIACELSGVELIQLDERRLEEIASIAQKNTIDKPSTTKKVRGKDKQFFKYFSDVGKMKTIIIDLLSKEKEKHSIMGIDLVLSVNYKIRIPKDRYMLAMYLIRNVCEDLVEEGKLIKDSVYLTGEKSINGKPYWNTYYGVKKGVSI
jgi:hypothetical protein